MSTYRGANLAWQLGGDRRLVRDLADGADALVLVECRTRDNCPVDVRAILGDRWLVRQNMRSPALSGTVIALRKGGSVKLRRNSPQRARLVRINTSGNGVQARYLRSIPVTDSQGDAMLFGAHMPIRSTGKQDEAVAAIRTEWRAIGGRKLMFADGNMRPAAFAEEVTIPHFDGNGVMFWGWSKGWPDVDVTWRQDDGSDHKTGTFRAE